MEKKKDREILSIEILYDYKEELDELVGNDDFSRLMFQEAIATIENALNKKRKTARVFYIPNIDCSVMLEYKNFIKVLNTAIQFYEQQEEYDECAKLVRLKERVNESEKRNKTSN